MKDASVVVHLELSSASHQRNISFIRVDVFASLFNLLYSLRVRQEGEDKICWVLSKRQLFDIRSFYSVLVRKNGSPFPRKSIWHNKASLSAAFFALLAALGKIITMDNLREDHYHG
jgi:hypothetical protein